MDGDQINIGIRDTKVAPAPEQVDGMKDNEITMAKEELEYNSMEEDKDWKE